jgi:hypothetical protein
METMVGHEACRRIGRVSTTGTAGAGGAATLIAPVAGQVWDEQ